MSGSVINLLSLLEATGDQTDADLAGRLRTVKDTVGIFDPGLAAAIHEHSGPDVGVRYVSLSGDDALTLGSLLCRPSTGFYLDPIQIRERLIS